MKKLIASILVGGALLASAPAAAQSSATASADSSATILTPVTLTKTSDLLFGKIVKPSTGSGTVSISNSADTVTAGSGAVALTSTTSRAKFTIGGEGGQTIALTIPSSFNLINGATNLGVTLTADLGSTTTLSGTGASTQTLNIGGSFNLPSTATTGVYAGTFSVTAAYN